MSNWPPSAITRSRIPISPNPSPAVALLRSTPPHPSSSIVRASHCGRPAAAGLGLPGKAESDPRLPRLRMLADIGEALLDNPIDMGGRRRRQALEVAIDHKGDLQISTASPFLIPGQGRKTGG